MSKEDPLSGLPPSLAIASVSAEQPKPLEHPLLRNKERIENDVIFNTVHNPESKKASKAQQDIRKASNHVAEMVRGLLQGRLEHELRPSAQILITELTTLLSHRELELLRQSLLLTRPRPHGQNIQGVITALLKECFDELELITKTETVDAAQTIEFPERPDLFASDDSNSQARVLGILRDLALHLATFLERSELDGINELQDLLIECQNDFYERFTKMRLSNMHLQAGNLFLTQVATAIFFDKLELICHDYIASRTDFTLTSGKIWASRYSRSDYMPFLYDSVEELAIKRPWIFDDEKSSERLLALQARLRADSEADGQLVQIEKLKDPRPLESILLEIRAQFGIGLNSLIKDEAELAIRFFERVLTLTADALEHPTQTSSQLGLRISRVRVQAYFCCAEAEIKEAAIRFAKASEKDQAKLGATIFEKKSQAIRKLVSKARYELELLGLSGLSIDVDGTSHSSLEGLGLWSVGVTEREEALFMSELARALNQFETSHRQLCIYLSLLLGFEAWEAQRFLDLTSHLKVEAKSGVQVRNGWRTQSFPAYPEKFIEEVLEKVAKLPAILRERFFSTLPVMIGLAFDFSDFDQGFELAIAHRQLLSRLISIIGSNPDHEMLFGVVDAEVRFRFSMLKSAKAAQESALVVLSQCRQKEKKGYFRELDRKRELRLVQSVNDISKSGALRDLSDFMEMQMLRQGIHGQFASQEIRMLTAFARTTTKRSLANPLEDLVLYRVEQRLKLSKDDVEELIKARGELKSGKNSLDPDRSLRRLSAQSRGLAALQILLDASYTCVLLQEEKLSRALLQASLDRFAAIFPGLSEMVETIFAAKSFEEFRRRVESAIELLEREALIGELSLMGSNTGAALGFMLTQDSSAGLATLFYRLSNIADISRRKVVPGRCKPLQRFSIATSWARLQRRVVGSVVALHDGLNISHLATRSSDKIRSPLAVKLKKIQNS